MQTCLFPLAQGCTTALKLRHAFKLDASHTRLELGLDFVVLEGGGGSLPLHLGTPNPWACLIYQVVMPCRCTTMLLNLQSCGQHLLAHSFKCTQLPATTSSPAGAARHVG